MATAPGLGSIPGPGDLVRQGIAGGLADLGSILRPLIEDTVSALTDRDDEERNTEDLGDEHADPREDDGESADGASHDKSLELNLDGRSWTLAVDADGQGIHLEMSDGQGGTARFGVEIGPDGLPQITAETDAGEGDAGDADCAPASPTPESQVSGGADDTADATTEEEPTAGRPAADDVPDHENAPALAPAGDAAAVPQPQVVSVQQEPVPETPAGPPPLDEPRSAPELATGPVTGFDSGAELAEAGPL